MSNISQEDEQCDSKEFLDELDPNVRSEYLKLKGKVNEQLEAEQSGDPLENDNEKKQLFAMLTKTLKREVKYKAELESFSNKISANSIKMKQFSKISSGDSENADFLKREIDSVQEELEDACERERYQKDLAEKLRVEVQYLTKNLEEIQIKEIESEKHLVELVDQKEKLSRERERVQEELNNCQNEVKDLLDTQAKLENYQVEAEKKINEMKQEIKKYRIDIASERKKKENLMIEIDSSQLQLGSKTEESIKIKKDNQNLQLEIEELESSIKEAKFEVSKVSDHYNTVKSENEFLKLEIEKQGKLMDEQKQNNEKALNDLKEKGLEIENLQKDFKKVELSKESLIKNLETAEQTKSLTQTDKMNLEAALEKSEKELENSKRLLEAEKKQLNDATREKNILGKNLLKISMNSQKQTQLLKLHENSKKSLEVEILNFRDEVNKHKKLINKLEKEREKYISEASDLSNKINNSLSTIKDKDSELSTLREQIEDMDSRLKQQRQLYETARNDRNNCSKNLTETQDQIVDSKKQLKILTHQVEQMKEEITYCELNLAKEKTERQKAEREREWLRNEVKRLLEKVSELQELYEGERNKKQEMEKKLTELERSSTNCAKESAKLVSQRDVLGSQLVKKSKEVELLCEKINIQQIILSRGELKYRERLNDINVLKSELKALNAELIRVDKQSGNIKEQKSRLELLEKQLNAERMTRQAVEKASETPLNVHRWRTLEAADPDHFQLVKKNHLMQRLILKKDSTIAISKENIKQLELDLENCRNKLKKMPGKELTLQCDMLKKGIQTKEEKLKLSLSENIALKERIQFLNNDISQLNEQLFSVKDRYFTLKKKDFDKKSDRDKSKSGIANENEKQIQPIIFGGGFNRQSKIKDRRIYDAVSAIIKLPNIKKKS